MCFFIVLSCRGDVYAFMLDTSKIETNRKHNIKKVSVKLVQKLYIIQKRPKKFFVPLIVVPIEYIEYKFF